MIPIMTIKHKVKRLPIEDYSHLEPLPDPEREPDMLHEDIRVSFVSALQAHFATRDDVLIGGGGFVRNEPTNNAERLAPDVVVTFGVRSDAIIARNGYVISEVGKPPDWVLEIASRSTGRRDYTVKRDGYAAYGIGEYWRFDHTGGRFHDAPLAGDLLVDGRYQPIELTRESDRMIWGSSPALGLDLVWDDGDLRVRDPLTLEFLPDARLMGDMIEAAEDRAHVAESKAERAKSRAERAEMERDNALAELARLRSDMDRLQSGSE